MEVHSQPQRQGRCRVGREQRALQATAVPLGGGGGGGAAPFAAGEASACTAAAAACAASVLRHTRACAKGLPRCRVFTPTLPQACLPGSATLTCCGFICASRGGVLVPLGARGRGVKHGRPASASCRKWGAVARQSRSAPARCSQPPPPPCLVPDSLPCHLEGTVSGPLTPLEAPPLCNAPRHVAHARCRRRDARPVDDLPSTRTLAAAPSMC